MKNKIKYLIVGLVIFGIIIMFYVLKTRNDDNKIQDVSKQTEGITENNLFKCSPDTLREKEKITVTLPTEHPKQLAVVSPKNEYYYIQFSPDALFMPEEDFIKAKSIEIPVNILGIVYQNGEIIKKQVFWESGDYKIILADNLETEPENSNYMDCVVNFNPVNSNT